MKYILRAKCLCIIYECGILPKFCGIITIPWQYPERVYNNKTCNNNKTSNFGSGWTVNFEKWNVELYLFLNPLFCRAAQRFGKRGSAKSKKRNVSEPETFRICGTYPSTKLLIDMLDTNNRR